MTTDSEKNTILKKREDADMNNEERILALLEQHSEMLAKINSRLDKTDSRLDKMDFRLDKMDFRLDKMDFRLDKMDSRLDIVESRLGKIDARLDRMEEYAETTRDGVNALLEWAEACSETYSLPLPKVGEL